MGEMLVAREERRLAAIVSADVVGYSRLMGVDESGTLAALRSHRTELIDPLIAEHGGRIVKTMGDGLLLEFASVLDAVSCFIEVQRAMAERNAATPDDRRMLFRVGINLGDIIIDGDDIHGDGVNVAARLEALCEPGDIAISGNVHEQVQGKSDVLFTDDGLHEAKNIAKPVQVWRWSPTVISAAAVADTVSDDALPLPDKPSIAVLPFANMSGDPEQEYFADGIAEDVITALSRFRSLFVIARNSSFTYKGRAVDITQVARELGVRYVVEGSVRRAGSRVRITAQLIDADTGNHIWAERYDRELDDIFAVQDDITERIVMAVGPELDLTEMARARRKNIPDLSVWELIARANWHGSNFAEKDVGEAEDLLYKALEIDPDNARIHAWLSRYYVHDGMFGWRRPPAQSRALALEMGQKAVALDKEDEHAHTQFGFSLAQSKRHEEATRRLRTAVRLNPNYSMALANLGIVLVWTHQHDEALELLRKAIQLSPKDPALPFYLTIIGIHHFIEERYEEALVWTEKAVHENPNHPSAYRLSASAHSMLGNLTEARAAYQQFDRLTRGVTISATLEAVPFAYEDDAERYVEGLRRAGMPE